MNHLKNSENILDVKITNVQQFYNIVAWLNKNVGIGSKNWSMNGHPLKKIKQGSQPIVKIYLRDEVDEQDILFLKLIS